MSSPSPRPEPATSPAASPPPSSDDPFQYTRFPDAGFGNKLANARNIHHTDVPPIAPLRTAAGSVAAEVANSVRRNYVPSPGLPKHGFEKGSYLSPFDYNIGSNMTSSSAQQSETAFPPSVDPGFAAFVARARTGPAMVGLQGDTTSDVAVSAVTRAVTPGPDAKPRLVLLAPLRMIRSTAIALRSDDRALLYHFLDSYMADFLHTIIESDPIIPSIIYKVSILMTDENWTKYNQVLRVFKHAKGVHEMLAIGDQEFDKYTMCLDPVHTSEEIAEGWRVLASGKDRSMTLEEVHQELVSVWKGSWVG